MISKRPSQFAIILNKAPIEIITTKETSNLLSKNRNRHIMDKLMWRYQPSFSS